MAKNNSIVLDIGAQVDKSWSTSLNNMGTDLNKVSKHISKSMQQYNKGADAVEHYQDKVDSLNKILNEGNATTQRYAEKIRYIEQQNEQLNTSTDKSKEKIKELNDELASQKDIIKKGKSGKLGLTEKEQQKFLSKAKDSDFLGATDISRRLQDLTNRRAQLEKQQATKQAELDTYKPGQKGIVAVREAVKQYAKEVKAIDKEITSLQKQLSKVRTFKNIDPNSNLAAKIQEKTAESVAKQMEKAEKASARISSAIERENNAIDRNSQKLTHNNQELAITEARRNEYTKSVESALTAYQTKLDEAEQQSNESVSNMGKTYMYYLAGQAGNAVKGITNAFKRLGRTALQTMGRLVGVFSKTVTQAIGVQKAMRLIVQYGFGFRSLYYLVRRFRSGIEQGFEYLGGAIKSSKKAINGFSEEVSKLLDTIKELMFYLKSAAAAMLQPFMPLINSIIPKLVAWFDRLAVAVANFIATLTGQAKIYRASTNLEDYANALDQVAGSADKAREALGAYDKLNVIHQDNSGGGSGGLDTSGWFTEQAVEPSSLAQLIKEAWEKADFTQVGVVIGEKFKTMLEGIDWDGNVFPMIERVAKSIATFINGFISVENLGTDIGSTIANVLNGIVDYVYTFVSTLNWSDLGKFITDGINGLLETFDAAQFGTAIHTLIDGMLTSAGEILGNTKWDELGQDIADFFANFDLGDLSEKLITVAGKFVTGFSTALDNWAKSDPESFGIAKAILTAVGLMKTVEVVVPIALQLGTSGVLDFSKMFSGEGSGLFAGIIDSFKNGALMQTITALSQDIMMNGFWPTITTFFQTGLESFASSIAGFLATPVGMIVAILGSGLVGEIANSWEEGKTPLENILTGLGNVWNNLYYNIIQPIINLIQAIVIPIWDALKETFVDVGGSLSNVLIPLCQVIASILSTVVFPAIKTVFDILTQVWNFISPVITTLISILGKLLAVALNVLASIIKAVTPVVQTIISLLGQVINWISGILVGALTTLSTKWAGVWEGIKAVTRNVANTIIGFLNRLLSGFGNMINGVVNGLNRLSWDAPGWLTSLTGIQSFGFNLPNVSIPQIPTLAQGAVIPPNKQFLAMLGDQTSGTNVEAPLDTIKQALVEALGESGRSGAPIVLQLDSKVVARAVWDENEKRYKQLGKYAY